jgi:serpin B
LPYENDPEVARKAINGWVEKENGSQDQGPGSIRRSRKTDALGHRQRDPFQGEWARKFPIDVTRDQPFYVSPGKSTPIPLMKQEGEFKYGESESVQVLELPYLGNTLSMLILLPRDKDGLTQLENSLSAENLMRWRSALREELVQVYLPRFGMTSTFRLDRTLSAMGMADAFIAGKADFSGMDGRPGWLYIGAVLHKTYVKVNEEGTEAAAATPAMSMPTAAPGQPPVFRAIIRSCSRFTRREVERFSSLGDWQNPPRSVGELCSEARRKWSSKPIRRVRRR